MHLSRREAIATLAALMARPTFSRAQGELPPVRAITRGPKHHWFGYYDKLQFDPTGRYVLGMELDFEHRSPKADDVIRIGIIDLKDGDRWTEIGTSRAWSWQQGCMLQWVPGSRSRIVWNDREGDRFVCHLYDTATKQRQTIPSAIYALSSDGTNAVTTDFRRLNHVRPGYGYAGLDDPYRDELTPKDSGLWRVDLATGKQTLLLNLVDVLKIGEPRDDWKGSKHWFNHLLYNTDGSRFVFLHRWRVPNDKISFRTRMITIRPDGSDPFVIDPSGYTSHFIWRDPQHLLAWTRPFGKPDGFYLFRDRTNEVEPIGPKVMTLNGHCTYLPGNQWILNDTYPDRERLQHPYLYDVKTGQRVPLGHFRSPVEYAGEWRCDTHPRFSPDGKQVIIDSPHGGEGRQMYLIDVSKIVG